MKYQEFYDLADEMEKACGDWENTEGMSENALKELMAKAEAMERENEKLKKSEKKKPRHFRLKKRYIVVLAAALSLLFGSAVVGDRAWISDSNDLERETEVTTKVDTDEKEDVLLEEEEIYREIGEKLGIIPIRLGNFLDGMVLDSYTIQEMTGWANINYLYHDNLICIKMAKKSKESSANVQWDGDSRKLENISNIHGYTECIEAYCIDEENQNYTANITFGNGYYSISGCFEDENNFIEILNGIYFKNL